MRTCRHFVLLSVCCFGRASLNETCPFPIIHTSLLYEGQEAAWFSLQNCVLSRTERNHFFIASHGCFFFFLMLIYFEGERA